MGSKSAEIQMESSSEANVIELTPKSKDRQKRKRKKSQKKEKKRKKVKKRKKLSQEEEKTHDNGSESDGGAQLAEEVVASTQADTTTSISSKNSSDDGDDDDDDDDDKSTVGSRSPEEDDVDKVLVNNMTLLAEEDNVDNDDLDNNFTNNSPVGSDQEGQFIGQEEKDSTKPTTKPYVSKYEGSPYLTPRDVNIQRRKYNVDDKFIVNQDSVEEGILQLPDFADNEFLLENQKDSYVKKMTFLFTGGDSEFALKLFILACLMSILVEIEDNKIGGGKNVTHPLYCFSRFQSDVSTGGECQFWIEIKPPQDTTKFLEETYTKLLEDLKEKDIKTGLLEYRSAIARTNWLRKILVIYIAWNIDGNNDAKRFEVRCNKKEVVTKVAYSIRYDLTITSDDTNPYFTYLDFKKWCQQAFGWIQNLLVDVKENKFRYCKLQKLIQGPPKNPPPEAKVNMDLYLKSMLQPKNAVKPKVNTNPRITEELKTEISAIFMKKKQKDKKRFADILEICTEHKEDFVQAVEKILEKKMKHDDRISKSIMEKLDNNTETQREWSHWTQQPTS